MVNTVWQIININWNKSGPRHEPWGTPYGMLLSWDWIAPTAVYGFLSLRHIKTDVKLGFCWQHLFGLLLSITASLKFITPNKTEMKKTAEKNWYISPPRLEPSACTTLWPLLQRPTTELPPLLSNQFWNFVSYCKQLLRTKREIPCA